MKRTSRVVELLLALLGLSLVLMACAERDHPEREVPLNSYSYGDVQEGAPVK